MTAERIGYWARSKQERGGHPWPGELIDKSWDPVERAAVVAYLEQAAEVARFRGTSQCRLCRRWAGCAEQSDGVYHWPDGYAHYIRDHGVKPPQEFIDHVKRQLDFGKATVTKSDEES